MKLSPLDTLDAQIARTLTRDRYRLLSRFRRARAEDAPEAVWQKLQQEVIHSIEKRKQRAAGKPDITYPDELPVAQRANEIEALIRNHQVIIVSGETGSGKTTQLPKICLAAGCGEAGLIGHTQPRRMAVRAVSARVAQELDTPLGEKVGYKIRFVDKTSDDAYIKLMTDGILLAEAQHDHWLSAYDTIIVDEAHERSLNIDFLLGFLKQLAPKRPELKIIITSATLDAERFAAHFVENGKPAPIIEISGRIYPVEVRYRPLNGNNDVSQDGDDEEDVEDAIADTVEDLWREGAGDILVFLPGEREIRETADILRKALRARPYAAQMEILPLFAQLSVAEQQRVFSRSNQRRIVLATNVAETSLTVPGIRYVIDTGLARIKRYSLRNKTTLLRIEKISQSAAKQRAGRCGRTAAGICVRLYDEDDFAQRPVYTVPEILRSSLASVILRLAALKLGKIENFPFLDLPSSRAIADGYQLLRELGAMDATGNLTASGWELSRLPLDPRIGKIVLTAKEKTCLPEGLIIASALTVPDVRERPFEKQQAADQAHSRFHDDHSDFVSLIALWRFFDDMLKEKLSHRKNVERCRASFINYLRMREWRDIHFQLTNELKEAGWQWEDKLSDNFSQEKFRALHESLLSGLLSNIGLKTENGDEYQGAREVHFWVHPCSGIKKGNRWLLAAELTETSRLFARCAAKIEPEWVEAVAGDLVNRDYYDPHWDEKRGEVSGFERVRLYGLTLVGKRRVSFNRVAPSVAHEVFVREVLVHGRLRTRGKFLAHNMKLIEEISALEHKARRQDVLVDADTIARFYFERVPENIAAQATFEYWREGKEREHPQYLFLTREYLMRHAAHWITEDLFPETMNVDKNALKLNYRFEPGHPCDGITLTVPLHLLNKLEEARLSWLVPGMVRDKITWYIKALPKTIRNRLVPVPSVVTAFLETNPVREKTLPDALRAWYRATYRDTIDAHIWDERNLPEHLKMRYEVVDADGHCLRDGRDLNILCAELKEMIKVSFSDMHEDKLHLERRSLTRWDFGELPESIAIERDGKKMTAYPALVDELTSVSLLLCDTPESALTATRQGIVRLIRLMLKDLLARWEKNTPTFQQSALLLRTQIPTDRLLDDIMNAVCDRAFIGEDVLPRNEKSFNEQIKRARTRFPAVAEGAFRLLSEIAAEHQQLITRINAASPTLRQLVDEVRAQRDALLYTGFFSQTPWTQLAHFPRYIKAMDRRLAKYPDRAVRDQKHGEQIAILWRRYQDRAKHNKKIGIHEPALEDYRWMIEEMRVSLFAQELKTPQPVSFKRIEKIWESIVSH
ncbi:MAG: ATP-dependent RNA helicase HrpA [Burkholderiales bacterium]|jgi:ATP-dependent helicase HrpA|nr:ATP-dependent RNA helicase HrpA [Burkholderiales bacterium]